MLKPLSSTQVLVNARTVQVECQCHKCSAVRRIGSYAINQQRFCGACTLIESRENGMHDDQMAPDSTAVRVALWRAMHVQVDPPPHVLEDEIGLRLAAPDNDWRQRPDMEPQATRGYRAGIVARARFIEDVVTEQAGRGVAQ